MFQGDSRKALLLGTCMLVLQTASAGQIRRVSDPKRNLIIFVADGLRNGSVNETDAPTLLSIRKRGVYFANSHSLFPTFTTANASAIATGHFLGDTGDFSNVVYANYQLFESGNFAKSPGTVTLFLEDDQRLGDLDDHFYGKFLNDPTRAGQRGLPRTEAA